MISCRGWLPYKRKEEGILKRIPNHKTLFCGRGLYFFFFTNRGYKILKQHPLSYFFGSMPYKVRQKLPLWTFRGRTLYRYLSRMLLRTLWRRITHYIRNVSWIGLEWARLQDGVLRLLLKKVVIEKMSLYSVWMIERVANYERATTDYQIVTILQVPKWHFDPLKGTRSTPFLFTTGISPRKRCCKRWKLYY